MIDIVIPAFNSVDLTWRCLQHVFLFPPEPYHDSSFMSPKQPRIYLVDNASSDDTPLLGRWLESRGHVYIRNEKNGGPYVAWNQGWRGGSADRVLFLNNDVSVMPGTLTALAESPFAYTCVEEVIGDYKMPEMLEYEDGCFGARNVSGPSASRYHMGYLHSCFMVDRDLLVALDGFDERFFLTYGDTDFMIRAKDVCDVSPRIDRAAVVHHGVSMTRRREFGAAHDTSLDMKDHQAFADKYKDRPEVVAAHPWRGLQKGFDDRRLAWSEGEKA